MTGLDDRSDGRPAAALDATFHDRWGWFVLVASMVIQIPFLNRGISYVDEGSILAIAESLRAGATLYRDRVTFIAPLVYELTGLLHRLFGPNILVSRLCAAAVFTACTMLVYRILRSMAGARWALVGAVAFLAVKPLAFPLWTILNYSQLAMLFTLAAMGAVLRFIAHGRLRWLVVAGLAVGCTLVTKQNAGVALGAAIAATMILHTWRHDAPAGRLVVYGAALLAGTLPPLLALIAFYAAHGALGEVIDQTVIGLRDYGPQYNVWLPGFEIWSLRPDLYGSVMFAYFPTPLWHLSWEGTVNLQALPIFAPCELMIRIAYLGPVAAIAFCAYEAVRTVRDEAGAAQWSALVHIVVTAALSFASMLYRADWAHLMNVYPPLLIVSIVALHRASVTVAARRAALGLVGAWVLAGVLMAAVIFKVYSVPVATPHGQLLAPSFEAQDAKRVLAYVAALPPETRVAFLREEPLYYYLTDRPMPTAFDLVMPAYLRPGSDARLARELRDVDEIIYNPKLMATIPGVITDYAAETAAMLRQNFRVAMVLSPTAFILRHREAVPRPEVTVVDLWSEFDRLRPEVRKGDRQMELPRDIQQQVTRTSWIVFRVVGTLIRDRGIPVCFSVSHRPAPGEAISTIPMLDPERWVPGERDIIPEQRDRWTRAVTFEVTVHSRDMPATTIFSEERRPQEIPAPVRIDLEPFVGRTVDLRFCATAQPNTPGAAYVAAGWAEPRIVRAGDGSQ